MSSPEEPPGGANEQVWTEGVFGPKDLSSPMPGLGGVQAFAASPQLRDHPGEPEELERSERPPSPVPSLMSMMSDKSMDPPLSFKGQEKITVMSAEKMLCDVCLSPAVKTCLTCNDSYCVTCIRLHYSDPDLERHQLQDLQLHGHDATGQDPQGTHPKSFINIHQQDRQEHVPPPGQIQFPSVKTDSVTVSWSQPEGAPGPHRYRVTWRRGPDQRRAIVKQLMMEVTGLLPGQKYHFTVATLSEKCSQSTCVERSVQTEIPAPENLCVDHQTTPASVKWTKPGGVDKVSYLLYLFREEECLKTVHTDRAEFVLPGLQMDTEYTVRVSTLLDGHDGQSQPVSKRFTNGLKECPDDLRIVLLGKTGVGKSSTGNTILGGKAFKAGTSAISVTKTCQRHAAQVSGRQITVIDTPGLFDTELGNEEIQRELTNCISLVLPGPHVFLLLIQVGRFTPEERQAVDIIKRMFGENSIKYTIVVFTRGDDLKNVPITEFLGIPGSPLMILTEQCGNRYHVLNNNETGDNTQVSALLGKIDYMVAVNGGGYYASRMFQQMEKALQEEKEKKIKEREEELVREKEDMRKENEDLQAKYKAKMERMNKKIEEERKNADEEKRSREEEFGERKQQFKTEIKEKEEQKEKMQIEMERQRDKWNQQERKKRDEEEKRSKKNEHHWNKRYERLKKGLEGVQQQRQQLERQKKDQEVCYKADMERIEQEKHNLERGNRQREEDVKRLKTEKEELERKTIDQMKREREEWEKQKQEENKKRDEEEGKRRKEDELTWNENCKIIQRQMEGVQQEMDKKINKLEDKHKAEMERIELERQERVGKMKGREEDMKKEYEDLKAKYNAKIERMKQTMEQERKNADEEKARREEELRKREQRFKTDMKETEEQKEKMQIEMERKQEEWERQNQQERKRKDEEEKRRKEEEHSWNDHYERLKKDMERIQQEREQLEREKKDLEIDYKTEIERINQERQTQERAAIQREDGFKKKEQQLKIEMKQKEEQERKMSEERKREQEEWKRKIDEEKKKLEAMHKGEMEKLKKTLEEERQHEERERRREEERKAERVPKHLMVNSITASSASLSWEVSPEMKQTPHSFLVSWSEGTELKCICTESCSADITGLKPGTEYTVRVYTGLNNSQPASVQMNTEIFGPEHLTVCSITASSASLSWEISAEMKQTPHHFLVCFQSEGTKSKSISTESCSADITGLKPGTKYTVEIYTMSTKRKSQPASDEIETEIFGPEHLTVSSITASSASLSWEISAEMEQTPHHFLVSYQSEGTKPKSICTESCSADITGLKPGTKYTVEVYTLSSKRKSQPASDEIETELLLPKMLSDLGLDRLHGGKLTLSSVLEIRRSTVTDEPPQNLKQLPWTF